MNDLEIIEELDKIVESNKELCYVETELLKDTLRLISSLKTCNRYAGERNKALMEENKKLTEQIDRIFYNENKVNDIKSFLKLNLDEIVYCDLRYNIGNRVNEIKIGTKGGEK